METFECDPQRLAKLDRRFANGEAPPSLHHVETSESDNSQSETIQVDNTSQEPQKVTLNTPDNTINKRNRKRKQDTPVDARGAIRPMKNQRPINAYFEPNETMKTPNAGKSSNANNRADNNGVSRNLLGVNDSSSDYGVTPFENGTNTSTSTGTAASTGVTASVVAAPTNSGGSTPQRNKATRKPRAEMASREVTCQTDMTRYEMDRLESGQAQKASAEKDDLVRKILRVENDLTAAKEDKVSLTEKFYKAIEQLKKELISKCEQERREARRKSMENKLKLGEWNTYRNDKWKDGTAFEDLKERELRLEVTRREIEKERRELSKRKPPSMAGGSNSSKQRENALSAEEYCTEDLILRNRLAQLKKEEQDVQYEREKLLSLRSLHIREMKRIQHEDVSKYKPNVLLKYDRYLLLNLLGKGGFSEVYKAYDLHEMMMVAIKIHQLNQDWTEQKKSDYQRHAKREAEIQKSIKHAKIIRLYDIFDVDINTFCTVLEYCEGNDLDLYLKQQNKNQISEAEAKTIITQIVQALKYLNELDKPVIHYDLKPGNILLADGAVCGNIKITDFGLSKQNPHGDDGIELTSQGAGTYWYLPPECFTRPNDRAPKIDNRVDVWSIGVIFYQCIYGKKPFGNNQSQQQILENKTIVNANEVNFPVRPPLSQDAKDFIRSCLIYRKEDRADIFSLASHHYLKPQIRRSGSKVIQPPPPSTDNSN